MSKPFTIIGAILLLAAAAIHAYRIYTGFAVVVAGHTIPVAGSWIAVVVLAIIGLMTLVESRR
jgi:hypothetical protein